MVESVMEGIALTGLDGIVTEANEKAVQMFGLRSEDELLGKTTLEFIAQRDRKRAAVDMQEIGKQGAVRYIDCTLLKADGSEYPGEIRASVKTDASGNPVGFIAVIRDVTERKRAEEALKESEERYRLLLECVTDGVQVQDREFRYLLVNDELARMAQMPKEKLLGSKMTDVFPGVEETVFFRTYKNVIETSEPGVASDEFVFEDGRRRWFKVHAYPAPEGLLVIVTDITEGKLMQERLIVSQRLATLGQFSGSISHELRNSLATIDSSVYYLKTMLRDTNGKVQEHLKRMKSSVDNATTTIQNLLNLTRMREPRLARLDFRAITSEAIAATKVPAGVRVTRDFPEQEVRVNADPEQLSMAFKNIVDNAVEAMEGKGTLTATVRSAADSQAEVSFADTGPGIPPEDLDRIFEPLFSTKAKGIGFGLSIAKMVIDRHGGTMEAKSGPGKGAILTIRLPLDINRGKEG